jgi:hypothetical protein
VALAALATTQLNASRWSDVGHARCSLVVRGECAPRELRISDGLVAWCHVIDGMLSLTRVWSSTGAARRPDRI